MRLRMRWLIQKLEFRNLFSPASCKVVSFPMVLDLMHECYVISFTDVFHFLIWRRSCFVVHFHISSQKLQGNGIGTLFFTLRTRENNEKLKLSSKNKARFFLLVTFDVDVCSNRKKVNFCVQYFVFWFIQILKLCKSLFYSRFWYKNLVGKCDLTFVNLQKVSPSRF